MEMPAGDRHRMTPSRHLGGGTGSQPARLSPCGRTLQNPLWRELVVAKGPQEFANNDVGLY